MTKWGFYIGQRIQYKGFSGHNQTAWVVDFTDKFVVISAHRGSKTDTTRRKPSNIQGEIIEN